MLIITGFEDVKVEVNKELMKSKLIESILDIEDVDILDLPLLTKQGVHLLLCVEFEIIFIIENNQDVLEYVKMVKYLMLDSDIIAYLINNFVIEELKDIIFIIENKDLLQPYIQNILTNQNSNLVQKLIILWPSCSIDDCLPILGHLSMRINVLIRRIFSYDFEGFEDLNIICTPEELLDTYNRYFIKNKYYNIQRHELLNCIYGDVLVLEECRFIDSEVNLYKLIECPEKTYQSNIIYFVKSEIEKKFGLKMLYDNGESYLTTGEKFYVLQSVNFRPFKTNLLNVTV
jgi:ribosomal protein S17